MERDIKEKRNFIWLITMGIILIGFLIAVLSLSVLKINDNKILAIILIVISSVSIILISVKLIYEIVKSTKIKNQADDEQKYSNAFAIKDFNYTTEFKTSDLYFSKKKNRQAKFGHLTSSEGFGYKYDSGEELDRIEENRRGRRSAINPDNVKTAILIAIGLIAMGVVTILLYIL